MEATDGDRVLVADFSAERARLGEANMMRLARPPAADDARLCGDELAVLLVAQADGLWGQPTTASLPGQDDRRGSRGVGRSEERFFGRVLRVLLCRLTQWPVGVGRPSPVDRGRELDRGELSRSSPRRGRRQRPSACSWPEIFMDPFGGLIVRLEKREVR